MDGDSAAFIMGQVSNDLGNCHGRGAILCAVVNFTFAFLRIEPNRNDYLSVFVLRS